VPKAAASRGPETSKAYLPLEAPGRVHSEARAFPRVEEVVETGRQVAKSCLSVPIIGWKSEGVDRF
jgi:hypothetical protein